MLVLSVQEDLWELDRSMGVARALGRWISRRQGGADQHAVQEQRSADDEARDALKALLEGLQACQRNDHRKAFDAFQNAFIAYIRADDRRSASLVQKTISLVIQKIDNPAKVRAARRNAVRMLRQARLQDEEVRALFFLADFEAKQRAFKDAYALYEESLSLAQSIHYSSGEAECLCRYARALALHGRIKEVKRRLSQAREAAERSLDEETIDFVNRWAEGLLSRGSFSISRASSPRAA